MIYHILSVVWENSEPINHDHFVFDHFVLTASLVFMLDSTEIIFNWLEGHAPLSQETQYVLSGEFSVPQIEYPLGGSHKLVVMFTSC